MATMQKRKREDKIVSGPRHDLSFVPQQTVLVLQGGGALGAYQCGVYQALQEAGIEPDWIVGTSIGAINGALIAGNKPSDRLTRLRMFWQRMTQDTDWRSAISWPALAESQSYWMMLLAGVPNFFEPNPLAFLGAQIRLGPDSAGFYSTAPLRKTLAELLTRHITN
jgi:NTE family protein